jgi:hypothetical protein
MIALENEGRLRRHAPAAHLSTCSFAEAFDLICFWFEKQTRPPSAAVASFPAA